MKKNVKKTTEEPTSQEEVIKPCLVCGKSTQVHEDLAGCLRKGFDLEEEWSLNRDTILTLATQKHFLRSWGQPGPGIVSFLFVDDSMVTTRVEDCAQILAKIILRQYVPRKDFPVEESNE